MHLFLYCLFRPPLSDEDHPCGTIPSGKKKRHLMKPTPEKSKKSRINFSNGGSLSDPLNLVGLEESTASATTKKSITSSESGLSMVKRVNNITDPLNLSADMDNISPGLHSPLGTYLALTSTPTLG